MNKILAQLGYAPTDGVAIIHAHDVSMCQVSLDSFADLERQGTYNHEHLCRGLRLTGKTVTPFTTHAMSGLGTTMRGYDALTYSSDEAQTGKAKQ